MTYTLLAGLQAASGGPLDGQPVRPSNPDQVVDVLEWFGYASGQVPRLTKKYFGKEQDVQTSGRARASQYCRCGRSKHLTKSAGWSR